MEQAPALLLRGEVLSQDAVGTFTHMIICQLRAKPLFIYGGKVVVYGSWEPIAENEQVRKVMQEVQQIVLPIFQFLEESISLQYFVGFLQCFDVGSWVGILDKVSQNRRDVDAKAQETMLLDCFEGICGAEGVSVSNVFLKHLMVLSVERWKHHRTGKGFDVPGDVDLNFLSLDEGWAVSFQQGAVNLKFLWPLLAVYFCSTRSSCDCERALAVLKRYQKSVRKKHACHAFLNDAAILKISGLMTKRALVDAKEVDGKPIAIATVWVLKCMKLWLVHLGRRWCASKVFKPIVKLPKKLKAKSRAAIRRNHFKTVARLARNFREKKCTISRTSAFGTPLAFHKMRADLAPTDAQIDTFKVSKGRRKARRQALLDLQRGIANPYVEQVRLAKVANVKAKSKLAVLNDRGRVARKALKCIHVVEVLDFNAAVVMAAVPSLRRALDATLVDIIVFKDLSMHTAYRKHKIGMVGHQASLVAMLLGQYAGAFAWLKSAAKDKKRHDQVQTNI